MPIDFSAILYGPVHAVLRVPVTLTLAGTSAEVETYALDKTTGVELAMGGGPDVQTVKPAAVMRAADLTDLEIAFEDLPDATLEMTGSTWRVQSYVVRPSPNGESDGEVYLILQKTT